MYSSAFDRQFAKSRQLFDIAKLVMHRGGAQGVVFLSTLFAARHATPDVFGQVGLFTSICSFFSMASGLRFEIRGLVCKQAQVRDKFMSMAYASNMAFFSLGILITGVCYLVSNAPAWILLVPLGVLLSSLIQYVLPAQHSTVSQLSRLGWMTQLVAMVTASLQVASSLLAPNAIALIGSRLFGWIAGAILMVSSIRRGVAGVAELERKDIKRIALCSRHEAIFGTFAAVVSVVTLQIPVYIFTLHSMQSQVGLYWLAFNLLFVPYLIVAGSVRPLYLRSTSAWRNTPQAYEKLKNYTLLASAAGVLIALALAVGCWIVVHFFLPLKWQGATGFALSLSLLLASLIAQTPISFSISSFNLQRFNLAGGVLQTVFRSIAMLLALQFTRDPAIAVLAFSATAAITYIVYIVYGLSLVKDRS